MLKIQTGRLHKPIEIEIDGTVYAVPPITVGLLEKIDAAENRFMRNGEVGALLDQIELLGIPRSQAETMDVRDLTAIAMHVRDCLANPTKEADENEKNG